MKRSFPPPAREALCALVGVLVCGAACEPNKDVAPGPPMKNVENPGLATFS